MLRNSTGELFFKKLNVFDLITHEISVINAVKTYWECIYEQVKVFTNNGIPLVADIFFKYSRVVCYVTASETDEIYHTQK
jgi:hypothetical protein